MSEQPGLPWFQLTDNDHSAWLVVASLSLFVYTCLAVVAKVSIFFNLVAFQLNDFALLIAMIFWTISVICIIASCHFGLGQHQATVDAASLEILSKASHHEYSQSF